MSKRTTYILIRVLVALLVTLILLNAFFFVGDVWVTRVLLIGIILYILGVFEDVEPPEDE